MEKTVYKPEGIKKQEEFLNKIHSQPLHCPACEKTHTYIELRGGNDWDKESADPLLCPNTNIELIHCSSLFAEVWLSKKPQPAEQ